VVTRFAIVINPAAGGGRAAEHLEAVRTVLDAAGADYLICESTSLAHAGALAAEAAERGDLVVAVGGDGLTSTVAGAVARAKPQGDGVFAVIPAGRGNDLARTQGIPFGSADAARLLLGGEPRPMDLMLVTGADGTQVTVALSVYLGVPSVAGEIANDIRRIRGPMVYRIAALRALASWKPALFTLNGMNSVPAAVTSPREFSGYGVVVANLPYFGAGMKVAPGADPDDGVLDVVLMRHAPKLTFLRVLSRIKDGSHVQLGQVTTCRVTALTIACDRPLPVGADGELLRISLPLRIRVLPNAVSVIAAR